MIRVTYCKSVALAVLGVLVLTPGGSQNTADTGIRELLVGMKANHRSTEQLALLFQVGDDNIADLISALSDPDKDVRLSAQIVIRYLGNTQGMNLWRKKYLEDQDVVLTGPIPTPLTDLDYDFLTSQYLKDKVITEPLMDAYLFALALDGSPKALRVLSDVIQNANRNGFKLQESKYVLANKGSIGQEVDLARQTLRLAKFLDPADSKQTSAKVIAYSGAKDKALVEIHVNRGPLAQEWYHVVVKRGVQGWTVFSITQVAVS